MEGSYYNAEDLNCTGKKKKTMGFNYIQLVCLKKKMKRSKTIEAENNKKKNPTSLFLSDRFQIFHGAVVSLLFTLAVPQHAQLMFFFFPR